MNRLLAFFLFGASCLAQAIVQPGGSGTLFADDPADRTGYIGSVGWFGIKAVSWSGPGADSFIAYADGPRLELMDDFKFPLAGGWLWQESGDDVPSWPVDVWLRVITIDDHDVTLARSIRFGFASSSASPLFVPEPPAWTLALAFISVGAVVYRRCSKP